MHAVQHFLTARVPATLLIAVITPEVVHVPHPSLQPTHAHNQFVFIYLFNLHIGIGLLALPKAFSEAGMVLGSILLIILAFVGYMTATYMIEAMAAANAYVKLEQREKKESSENESSSDAQKVNQVHVGFTLLTSDVLYSPTHPMVPGKVNPPPDGIRGRMLLGGCSEATSADCCSFGLNPPDFRASC